MKKISAGDERWLRDIAASTPPSSPPTKAEKAALRASIAAALSGAARPTPAALATLAAFADKRAVADAANGLEAQSRSRPLKNVPLPTQIADGIDKVRLSRRAEVTLREGSVIVRPVADMPASARTRVVEAPSFGITLQGATQIVGAALLTKRSLASVLQPNDARREALSGFDLKAPRDFLVLNVEGQAQPILVVGSVGDQPGDKPGVTVISSSVRRLPFKDAERPRISIH